MRALCTVCTALVLGLHGCVGSGPAAEQQAREPSARLPVHVEFVPPLAAPGQLRIAHECGEQLVVTTACSSVDLWLPPGPVVFVLQAGGRAHEYAATVAPGMAAIVWNLATTPWTSP
ncbi:MAG TPA: hypothetical protein VFD82_19725 [Planctomycetota bacterium]|nr:hypothetical protein [Planctomycetota bacterium]